MTEATMGISPVLMIYPAIAMFLLTAAVTARTGWARFTGIRNRDVSMRYYRLYNEGEEPRELRQLSRHLQNQFEFPPLFHVAVLFTFVADVVTLAAIVMAWAYVALRAVHTAVHLGSNNVTHRFAVFIASGLALLALWIHLLLQLLLR